MSDLTQYIPQESETVKAIYRWHKEIGDSEPERGYLGASIIGHECERCLWYTFRNCVKPNFDGRMYRLFETGDLEEARFVKELRAIGCEVHDVDENGEQFEVKALGGHFSGHMDGVALGIPEAPQTWHVLEFKTHNAKSFAKLKKEGVRVSKFQHYAQMMVYMGLAGMKRALYLARNKDTDELYSERIRYNASEFNGFMAKAERIIKAQQPPERIANRPDCFQCKFCAAKELCWGDTSNVAVPLPCVSCRTCCHATPVIDKGGSEARWSCASIQDFNLPFELQQEGCESHMLLPGLVSFAEPVDAGEDWIEFKNKDGVTWRHGNGLNGTWNTERLIVGRGPLDNPNPVKQPPTPLDDKEHQSLIEKYPHEDSTLLWDGPEIDIMRGLDLFVDDLTVVNKEKTDEYEAWEYAEGKLLVLYLDDNHGAIWKGKE